MPKSVEFIHKKFVKSHFKINDLKYALCIICEEVLYQGGLNSRQSVSGMKNHLKQKHSEELKRFHEFSDNYVENRRQKKVSCPESLKKLCIKCLLKGNSYFWFLQCCQVHPLPVRRLFQPENFVQWIKNSYFQVKHITILFHHFRRRMLNTVWIHLGCLTKNMNGNTNENRF